MAWRAGKPIAPDGISLDAVFATIPTPLLAWISEAQAAELVGGNTTEIQKAVRHGLIERRSASRRHPSIARAPAYAEARRKRTRERASNRERPLLGEHGHPTSG